MKIVQIILKKKNIRSTSLVNEGSDPDTVIESSEIPPLIRPRSPTGLHSIVGAKPVLQRQ